MACLSNVGAPRVLQPRPLVRIQRITVCCHRLHTNTHTNKHTHVDKQIDTYANTFASQHQPTSGQALIHRHRSYILHVQRAHERHRDRDTARAGTCMCARESQKGKRVGAKGECREGASKQVYVREREQARQRASERENARGRREQE